MIFPTHRTVGAGLLPVEGPVLIRRGRCLVENGAGDLLIVWPEGTSFRPDPDGGAVVDEEGQIIVRVGEPLPAGVGGYVPPREARDISSEFPAECAGREVEPDGPAPGAPDAVGCCLVITAFGPEFAYQGD